MAMVRSDEGQTPSLLADLLAFALSLGLAWYLEWQVTDLVWSLWFSSLVIGSLSLLVVLGSGIYLGQQALNRSTASPGQAKSLRLAGGGMALFLLGFFALHFCGFHAGHSAFLNAFFPLDGVPAGGFSNAFVNPPFLWYQAWHHLAAKYWYFLIPMLLAERHQIFKPLYQARAIVAEGNLSPEGAQRLLSKGKGNKLVSQAMARPYVNVMRMHLLIFFFAFSHHLGLDSFLVIAVIYLVYFFPWTLLRQHLHQGSGGQG